MELLDNIEIYTAMPYGGENNNPDEWFHIGRNEKSEHIEDVLDIESLFRPDISIEDKPPLLNVEECFTCIRFHYALDYTSQRYHEDLMLWAMKSLKRGGKLHIITRNGDWILRYWLADALSISSSDYTVDMIKDAQINELADKLAIKEKELEGNENQIEELRQQIRQAPSSKKSWWKPKFIRNEKGYVLNLLNEAGIPSTQFEQKPREEMVQEIPDRIIEDVERDEDFDVWLQQQLFSSGAGEPQDCFKSLCSMRYLSGLFRRTRFITELLQEVPENPRHIEAKLLKHPLRLL